MFKEVSKRISALERPAGQRRIEGPPRQPLEPFATRKCYWCGKYGHLASSCTKPAPAPDIPKTPQILPRPASTPATSTTPGTTSTTAAANVELVDLGDSRLDNWSGINAVQLTYSDGALDVRRTLDRAYALGEKRVHEEAFDTTSKRPRRKLRRTKGKRPPAERRHVKAIRNEQPLDFKKLFERTTTEISLAQLVDILPLARVSISRLLKLQPKQSQRAKGKSPEQRSDTEPPSRPQRQRRS